MDILTLAGKKLQPKLQERIGKIKKEENGEEILRNISEEERIPNEMKIFLERLCSQDKDNKTPSEAIRKSIEEEPDLYMKLEIKPESKNKIPDKVYNFSCFTFLQKRYIKTQLPDEVLSKKMITLEKSLHKDRKPLFLWVTFNTNKSQIPINDEEKIRNELGLEHFPPDDIIFYAEIELSHNEDLFIPNIT